MPMMQMLKAGALAAALLCAGATGALAITVTDPDTLGTPFALTADANGARFGIIRPTTPGTSQNVLVFTFVVAEALVLPEFSIVGTGSGANGRALQDIQDVRFGLGLTGPFEGRFTPFPVSPSGTTRQGGGFLTGGTYAAGDVISVSILDGIRNPVAIGVSFQTEALPPPPVPPVPEVPVPAAGGMLLLSLGALAVAARRRAGA